MMLGRSAALNATTATAATAAPRHYRVSAATADSAAPASTAAANHFREKKKKLQVPPRVAATTGQGIARARDSRRNLRRLRSRGLFDRLAGTSAPPLFLLPPVDSDAALDEGNNSTDTDGDGHDYGDEDRRGASVDDDDHGDAETDDRDYDDEEDDASAAVSSASADRTIAASLRVL
ncbi:hypothetical protein HK405_002612, partial [Cladochytrium tenue]